MNWVVLISQGLAIVNSLVHFGVIVLVVVWMSSKKRRENLQIARLVEIKQTLETILARPEQGPSSADRGGAAWI